MPGGCPPPTGLAAHPPPLRGRISALGDGEDLFFLEDHAQAMGNPSFSLVHPGFYLASARHLLWRS